MYYAKAAYALSAKNNFKTGIAESLTNQGYININSGRLAQGYENYQLAMELFNEINDEKGRASVYEGLGVTYGMQENYTEAMSYFNKALTIQERIGSPGVIANSYIKIGLLHQKNDEEEKALKSFERALLLSKKAGDKRNEASAYVNIGMLYGEKGQFEKLLEATEKAKVISEEANYIPIAATAYINIGMAYKELNQYSKAESYLNKAIKYFTQLKNQEQVARTYNGLANLHIKQKQYKQAVECVKTSNQIAEGLNNKLLLYDNYELIIEIDKVKGKFENIDKYYTRLLALKDTLFIAEKNNSLEHLKASYLLEEKQETIDKLKKENLAKTRQRNNLIILFAVGCIFTAILASNFINIKRKTDLFY